MAQTSVFYGVPCFTCRTAVVLSLNLKGSVFNFKRLVFPAEAAAACIREKTYIYTHTVLHTSTPPVAPKLFFFPLHCRHILALMVPTALVNSGHKYSLPSSRANRVFHMVP